MQSSLRPPASLRLLYVCMRVVSSSRIGKRLLACGTEAVGRCGWERWPLQPLPNYVSCVTACAWQLSGAAPTQQVWYACGACSQEPALAP
ncbi:hypothetical protein V8C86DRAFT_2787271 [Haematococcus lacustris]